MILRKSMIGISSVILVTVVCLIWYAVVSFASLWIGGLDQCEVDGCGPKAPIWQDILLVIVLVVPPLAVSLLVTSYAAKKILY